MKHFTVGIGVKPDHHVLKRSHLPEQTQILECPPDACCSTPLRRHIAYIPAIERDQTADLPDMTRYQIKNSRFARTVRPNKSVDMARLYRHIYAANRHDAAKATAQLFSLQEPAHCAI